MKELYYPSINIREDNWLKYSLLFKENLYTINPVMYSNYNHDYINSRIDSEFIKSYNPERYMTLSDDVYYTFEQQVINCFSLIHLRRDDFQLFRNSAFNQNRTLDDSLRNVTKNSTLFRGKFTEEIKRMVIEYGYGELTNGNLKVSNRFAIIYMGLLAEKISSLDSKVDSKVRITGKAYNINQYLNNAKILNQGPLPLINLSDRAECDEYKHKALDILLPENIENISIERIARIRTDEYLNLIKDFNSLFDKLYKKATNFEDCESIFKEMFDIKIAIEELIHSKVGRLGSSFVLNGIMSGYNVPFPMSWAISLIVGNLLSNSHTPSDALTFRESNNTMKLITTLNSI